MLSAPFSKSTIFAVVGLLAPIGVLCITFLTVFQPVSAAINEELHFQARLLTSAGGLASDGNYNIQFHIYSGGDGNPATADESLEWSGSYLKGNTQGIDVVNGYVSAQLGESGSAQVNTLTDVPWDNDTLWLSINIGDASSASTSCTTEANFNSNCGGDGEMGPFLRLGSTPYAFNSKLLGGRDESQFVQLNPGGTAQDVNTTNSAIHVNQQGTGNIIALQDGGTTVFRVADGGNVLLGSNSKQGNLLLSDGGVTANYITLRAISSLGQDSVITIPDPGGATDTVCLVGLGNCAGSGGGVVGTGTTNRVAYWTGSGTIAADDDLFFDGTNLGVGNTSPDGKLDVAGTAYIGNSTTNAVRIEAGLIRMQDNTDSGRSLTIQATNIVAGQLNSHTYSYSSGGQIASVGTGNGAILFDAGGAVSTDSTFRIVLNGGGDYPYLNLFNKNTLESTFYANSFTNFVGIGTDTPDAKLEVAGNVSAAAWGLNGLQIQAVSATFTNTSTAASGTVTNSVINSFGTPTIAATNASVTTTNAANVYIQGAPTAGTNQTITNSYAFWVDSGLSRFDTGGVLVGSDTDKYSTFLLEVQNSTDVAIGVTAGNNTSASRIYLGYENAETGGGRIEYSHSNATLGLYANGGTGYLQVNLNSTLTVGNDTFDGEIALSLGGSNYLTIDGGLTAGNYTLTVPTITGSDTFCLVTLANCSGSSSTLQTAYEAGNTIVATDAEGDIDLTVSQARNFSVDITGTGNFYVQDGGSNVLTVADGGATTLQNTVNSATALRVLNASASQIFVVDTTNNQIGFNRATHISDSDTYLDFASNDRIHLVAGGETFIDAYEVAGQDVLYLGTTTDIDVNIDNGTLIVDAGLNAVAIGIAAPSAKLHAVATTEQFRLGYDGSNYSSFTVGSTGNLTVAPTGGTTDFTGQVRAKTSIASNIFSVNNTATQYASNGGAEDNASFFTAWNAPPAGGSVSRTTVSANYTNGVAGVSVVTGATNMGVKNNLSSLLDTSTTYQVSFVGRVSSGTWSTMQVKYSREVVGGGDDIDCTNYNTNTLTTTFGRITCTFTTDGTTPTDSDIFITQTDSTTRTIYYDNLSVTKLVSGATPNNVKVGGGTSGGSTTLLTLDQSSFAPLTGDSPAYYGSMYYDTSLNQVRCYTSSGWGDCGSSSGSSSDNYVNLQPEFSSAQLEGSGIGTMTAGFCANESGVLTVNTSLCGSGESRNYYNWTSSQGTSQTYSIFVTYQLPDNFSEFEDNSTVQLTARTDNTTDGSVTYEMFRKESGTISACGTATAVTSSVDTWQTVGINGDENDGCGFSTSSAGAFVIFKINVSARSNANVYVSNLSFTTTPQ